MNVEKARIFVLDTNTEELVSFGVANQSTRYPINTGIAGHVAVNGEVLYLANAYHHHLYNGIIDIETSMPLVCWPIKLPNRESETIGVFQVMNVKGILGFSNTQKPKLNIFDFETLDFFSKQLAQSILNCQLWEQYRNKSTSIGSFLERKSRKRTEQLILKGLPDTEPSHIHPQDLIKTHLNVVGEDKEERAA